MKRIINIVLIWIIPMISGCATAYVAHLRSEYSSDGKAYGVYYGDEEYPCLYPATRIAAAVEVPTWWWPTKTSSGSGYESWLWPFGAILSVADVPCSVVTDTIMLPYDYKNMR